MINRHRIDNTNRRDIADNLAATLVLRDSVAAIAADIAIGDVSTAAIESASTLNIGNSSTVLNVGCGGAQTVNFGQNGGVTTITLGAAGDTIIVAGTLARVDTTNLNVTANATLNVGGATAPDAGIYIEEAAVDIAYVKVAADRTSVRFKAPASSEITIGNTVVAPQISISLRDLTPAVLTVTGQFTGPRNTPTIDLRFIRIGSTVNLHIPAVGIAATVTPGQPYFIWSNPAGVPNAFRPRYFNGVSYASRAQQPCLIVDDGADALGMVLVVFNTANIDGTIISNYGDIMVNVLLAANPYSGLVGWTSPINMEYQLDVPLNTI